jgi:hypothetical protein
MMRLPSFFAVPALALSLALSLCAFAGPAAAQESSGIYATDMVRGFVGLSADFRGIKKSAITVIRDATQQNFDRTYFDGHVNIGAEYYQLLTWFDINFMLPTAEKGQAEWFNYGISWMWGYKLLPQDNFFNVIPSLGVGVDLLNVRGVAVDVVNSNEMLSSTLGMHLNPELELRLQFSQLSLGLYGGYKVARFDGISDGILAGSAYCAENAASARCTDPKWDLNADQWFVGLKLNWTFLSGYQTKMKNRL